MRKSIFIFISFALLLSCTLSFLHSNYAKPWIKASVEVILTKISGCDITVINVAVCLLYSFRIEDAVLRDGGNPPIHISKIHAQLSLKNLLQGKMDFPSIDLENVRCKEGSIEAKNVRISLSLTEIFKGPRHNFS